MFNFQRISFICYLAFVLSVHTFVPVCFKRERERDPICPKQTLEGSMKSPKPHNSFQGNCCHPVSILQLYKQTPCWLDSPPWTGRWTLKLALSGLVRILLFFSLSNLVSTGKTRIKFSTNYVSFTKQQLKSLSPYATVPHRTVRIHIWDRDLEVK